jgi:hypothetical protein
MNGYLLLRAGEIPPKSLKQKGKHQASPISGAGDEARTRDLNLGKVALYQLSYSRKICMPDGYRAVQPLKPGPSDERLPEHHERLETGAGDEARTRDLNLGKVALYQLSYSRIYRRALTTVFTANFPAVPLPAGRGFCCFFVAPYCAWRRETRL